jgi:hypothetical protein
MSVRRWLVLPLLSPLLAVLLVAALNPRPQLAIRVLTWTSPRAPLGLWLAGAALGGAALSGAGSVLALRQGAAIRERRRVTTRRAEPWSRGGGRDGDGWSQPGGPPAEGRSWAWDPEAEGESASAMDDGAETWRDGREAVAPPRSPGDPAPTVAVPFRVLRRPQPSEAPFRASVPVAVEDTWGATPAADEW